jgi:hypothetical protein
VVSLTLSMHSDLKNGWRNERTLRWAFLKSAQKVPVSPDPLSFQLPKPLSQFNHFPIHQVGNLTYPKPMLSQNFLRVMPHPR